MAKTLKKIIENIFDVDNGVGPDVIYSVFDRWLTDEECSNELMYHSDINSFSSYKIFKSREYNYLKLLIDLNENLKLEYIDLKTNKIVKEIDFHFIFLSLNKHFFQDKEILLRVSNTNTFILISHDFSIFIYYINDLHKVLKSIFKKHHFYLLFKRG